MENEVDDMGGTRTAIVMGQAQHVHDSRCREWTKRSSDVRLGLHLKAGTGHGFTLITSWLDA